MPRDTAVTNSRDGGLGGRTTQPDLRWGGGEGAAIAGRIPGTDNEVESATCPEHLLRGGPCAGDQGGRAGMSRGSPEPKSMFRVIL